MFPTYNRVILRVVEQKAPGRVLISEHPVYGVGEVVEVGPTAGKREDKVFHNFAKGVKVTYLKNGALHPGMPGLASDEIMIEDNNILGFI